jgi:hypothetical protein
MLLLEATSCRKKWKDNGDEWVKIAMNYKPKKGSVKVDMSIPFWFAIRYCFPLKYARVISS